MIHDNQFTTSSINQSLTLVIPTLWKVSTFPKRIMSLVEKSVISQIIIIDNNPAESVHLSHPKIKILSPGANIYVNPAWNLGMQHASSRFSCLLNDDIDATEELLEYAVSILNSDDNNHIGIIGMDWSKEDKVLDDRVVRWRTNNHFGAAMFFRTKEYSPIPSSLRIWCGDDYLLLYFHLEGKQIIEISGFGYDMDDEFSTSINSDRESFDPIIEKDLENWVDASKRICLRYRPISTLCKIIFDKIYTIFRK